MNHLVDHDRQRPERRKGKSTKLIRCAGLVASGAMVAVSLAGCGSDSTDRRFDPAATVANSEAIDYAESPERNSTISARVQTAGQALKLAVDQGYFGSVNIVERDDFVTIQRQPAPGDALATSFSLNVTKKNSAVLALTIRHSDLPRVSFVNPTQNFLLGQPGTAGWDIGYTPPTQNSESTTLWSGTLEAVNATAGDLRTIDTWALGALEKNMRRSGAA